MAIREIVQGDVPSLRTPAEPVVQFDVMLENLLTDLQDTLSFHRGLGLSALQIGEPWRVLMIDVGQGCQEFINPEITLAEGEQEAYESCLSFPNHTLKITRPQLIVVSAQDRTGQSIQVEASGLLARVLAHEINHLNGVLFMDHLSEEDMFAQLFGSALTWDNSDDDGDLSDVMAMDDTALAIDMFSELAWKFTLCLELFREDESLKKRLNFGQLEQIEANLQQIVDQLEEHTQ